MSPECVECSEKDTLGRIEKGVDVIRKALFESANGDSYATQISKNTDARTKNSSRVWDIAQLILAAAIPIAFLWLTGRL